MSEARHHLTDTLPWLADGTRQLLSIVDSLGDDELGAPSGLPGWSRAHVLGHVARNAEALGRLLHWARTGEETPMYADAEARAKEIETSARQPAAQLRADCAATAAELDHSLSTMDDAAWAATVRSAQGRTIPAAEVPWMRNREVWLHAVDLGTVAVGTVAVGTGVSTADFPPGLLDVLIADVAAKLSADAACPPVELTATDRDALRVRLGDPAATPEPVHATAAELAAWLTGRGGAPGGTSGGPELPRWL